MDDLYPLRMRPVFKDYIWGGNSLKKMYHKNTPYKRTAESWEVAVHKDGCSLVDNGAFAGQPLDRVMKQLGAELTGELCEGEKFPLMLKLIDAKDDLSVQVHPDDIYADQHENGELGKTEMWYVLSADSKAQLIYGFRKDLTEQEFRDAIQNHRLKDVLNYVDAEEGDVFFIEAGQIHAIGEGLVLAEIQQNSNTTYRVYDWDRVDANGKPRPLHIEKALAVSNLESSKGHEKTPVLKVEEEGGVRKFLSCCRYFAAEHVEVDSFSNEQTDGRSFHILLFTDDQTTIRYQGGEIEAHCGESFLIPAEMGEYTVSGKCEYLKFYVAEFEKDILEPLIDAGYIEDEVLALLR